MPGNFFQKNSARFLKSFKQIDSFLSQQLHCRLKSTHFYEKVDMWYDMGYLSRNQFYDLLQFSKLRNAIVHEYMNDMAIAEPSSAAVKRIEHLKIEICRPKKLHELFQKTVYTANTDDCVGDVLSMFWKYKISQVPILESDEIVNVLNTNTISWWIAATKPDNIPKAKIKQLLDYSLHQNNFEVLPEKADLPEAVRVFRQSYSKVNRGWFMDAILITKDGKPLTPIKGIIVLEDLTDYLI